jgi:hypothetical protein
MSDKATVVRAHDVATRIYVELVARHAHVADGSVKMAVSAEHLAQLSLRLAEVFVNADAAATAGKQPVKDFKLDGNDIASWSKPA